MSEYSPLHLRIAGGIKGIVDIKQLAPNLHSISVIIISRCMAMYEML